MTVGATTNGPHVELLAAIRRNARAGISGREIVICNGLRGCVGLLPTCLPEREIEPSATTTGYDRQPTRTHEAMSNQPHTAPRDLYPNRTRLSTRWSRRASRRTTVAARFAGRGVCGVRAFLPYNAVTRLRHDCSVRRTLRVQD